MKVTLINKPYAMLELMYVAARTCYSAKAPSEMWGEILDDTIKEDYHAPEKFLDKVLSSGHTSIAEHINFTFAIDGISRACSHQLVRHRHCSFSQQSQRYVEIKEDLNTLYDLLHSSSDESKLKKKEIAQKYFVDVNDDNYYGYVWCLYEYVRRIANGEKAEDARNILPNATKTNIVMTCNLRELMHICNLRLCTRAQREIRELVKRMRDELVEVEPFLDKYLQPKCEQLGFCTEHQCCGRKPKLDTAQVKS